MFLLIPVVSVLIFWQCKGTTISSFCKIILQNKHVKKHVKTQAIFGQTFAFRVSSFHLLFSMCYKERENIFILVCMQRKLIFQNVTRNAWNAKRFLYTLRTRYYPRNSWIIVCTNPYWKGWQSYLRMLTLFPDKVDVKISSTSKKYSHFYMYSHLKPYILVA